MALSGLNVIVTGSAGRSLMKASRLKVIIATPESATALSVLEKAACCRKIASPGSTVPLWLLSTNTIQPVSQRVLLLQVLPETEAQALTYEPRLFASARVNCKSPSKALIAPEIRLLLENERYDGTPMLNNTPIMVMTTSNSISVTPRTACAQKPFLWGGARSGFRWSNEGISHRRN